MTRAQRHAVWALERSAPMPMTKDGIQNNLYRVTNLPADEINSLDMDFAEVRETSVFGLVAYTIA